MAKRQPPASSRRYIPTYPDHTLEDAARAAGLRVDVMWEIPGPENTLIDWMVCYRIGRWAVIVQTYHEGNGWQAFTQSTTNDTEKTIHEVIQLCR